MRRPPDKRMQLTREPSGVEGVITIRHMQAAELDRIGEIDRSEHVTREYSYQCGFLETRTVDVVIPTWSRSGDQEHSVQGRVDAWQPILDRGGTLVGAFDAETLAGFAIYQPRLAQGMANLSVLCVSRSYRRKVLPEPRVRADRRAERGAPCARA